jgi:hypothetical protein
MLSPCMLSPCMLSPCMLSLCVYIMEGLVQYVGHKLAYMYKLHGRCITLGKVKVHPVTGPEGPVEV